MALEVWAEGEAYENYVGRWSRRVTRAMVGLLGLPPGGFRLDVGCGTGALSEALLGTDPDGVVGVDPSVGFLTVARAQVTDPRVSFVAGDARFLPVKPGHFDAVVSALVLNFVPDPLEAVREFVRVVAPGGTVAAAVWDYAEGMAMVRHFWDAAIELDPAARERDEGRRFPLCRPQPLRELWRAAGLKPRLDAVEVPTDFKDFDDYWQPFLKGAFPGPAYLKSLPEERQAALRESLRERLDGQQLTARAWVVSSRG